MKTRETWCEDLRDFWKWHIFVKDMHSPDLLAIDVFSNDTRTDQTHKGFKANVVRIPIEFLEGNALDEVHKILGDCSYCQRHQAVFGSTCGAKE